MNQQFAGAQGSVVENVAVLVGANVAVQEPKFAVLNQSVGILEVRTSGPDRLHFSTCQHHTSLKFFQQEIVMSSDPINSGISLPGRRRVATGILLRTGSGLMRLLSCHGQG